MKVDSEILDAVSTLISDFQKRNKHWKFSHDYRCIEKRSFQNSVGELKHFLCQEY